MSSKTIAAKIKDLQAEFATAAKAEFAEGAKALFAKYPALKSFGCAAYTPYFNDGDQCQFNVEKDYPEINGEEVAWDSKDRMAKDIRAYLMSFDDDFYLAAFGDHVKITATAHGVETEEYEHD